MSIQLSPNEVVTPAAILSYPALFEPQAFEEGQKPKYKATLVFTPEVQKTPDFQKLIDAVNYAAQDKWGEQKVQSMLKSNKLRLPFLQDPDAGYPDNSFFIRTTSTRKPTVLRWDKEVIEDAEEMYPGCLVRAYIIAKAYDHPANKGVSFYLQHIQKLGEGERLAGRKRADSVFDAVEPTGNLEEEVETPSENTDTPVPNIPVSAKKGTMDFVGKSLINTN